MAVAQLDPKTALVIFDLQKRNYEMVPGGTMNAVVENARDLAIGLFVLDTHAALHFGRFHGVAAPSKP